MVLAARGARENDSGTEAIDDAALAEALRRRARDVWAKTVMATIAATGLLVVFS